MLAKIHCSEPILIPDIYSNNFTNLEIETMSQDLSDTFKIEVQSTNCEEQYLNLIPKRKILDISDVLCYGADEKYCKFEERNICEIELEKIPNYLNHINILLNCFDYRNMSHFNMAFSDKTGIFMSFAAFSFPKAQLLHLGILAKTDNNTWKFYPRFHYYQEDLNTLLKFDNSFLH